MSETTVRYDPDELERTLDRLLPDRHWAEQRYTPGAVPLSAPVVDMVHCACCSRQPHLCSHGQPCEGS